MDVICEVASYRETSSVRWKLKKNQANLKRVLEKFRSSRETLSVLDNQLSTLKTRTADEGRPFLVYAGEQASPAEQASLGNETKH